MVNTAAALAYALLGFVARAYSWPRISSSVVNRDVNHASDYAQSGLADEEYTTRLFQLGSDALERFQRQPDCFSRVAKVIQHQCVRLDRHQDERVAGAIAMTLCEIRTAKHYSVPMECSSFDVDALETRQDESRSSGPCVDALSRSAQLWSSYSGYLREIPLLCVAFQKLSDIDVAREIYRNVTLEKSEFLRFLQDHRNREIERQMRASTQQHGFESVLVGLNGVVSSLRAVVEAGLSESVKAAIAEMNTHLHLTAVSTMGDIQLYHADFLQQSTSSLAHIIASHSVEASEITRTMGAAIERHLDMLATQHMLHEERLALAANLALDTFSTMERNMDQFNHAVGLVSDKLDILVNDAERATLNLEQIGKGHMGLATITSDLSFSLRALTNHVRTEFQSINTTIADIQQGIHIRSGLWDVSNRILSSWLSLPWIVWLLPSGFRSMLLLFVLALRFLLSFPLPRLVKWTVLRSMDRRSTRGSTLEPNCIMDGVTPAEVYYPRSRTPGITVAGVGQGQLYSIMQQGGRKSSRIPSRLLL